MFVITNFPKLLKFLKKVIACPNQLESNDLMMASYVFEQSGDKVLAEQVRQDSLKSVMAIDNIPLEKNEENMLKKEISFQKQIIIDKTHFNEVRFIMFYIFIDF